MVTTSPEFKMVVNIKNDNYPYQSYSSIGVNGLEDGNISLYFVKGEAADATIWNVRYNPEGLQRSGTVEIEKSDGTTIGENWSENTSQSGNLKVNGSQIQGDKYLASRILDEVIALIEEGFDPLVYHLLEKEEAPNVDIEELLGALRRSQDSN